MLAERSIDRAAVVKCWYDLAGINEAPAPVKNLRYFANLQNLQVPDLITKVLLLAIPSSMDFGRIFSSGGHATFDFSRP